MPQMESMTIHRPQIACIVGPTASGKTALSIRVAQMTGAEIVSADSVQVYCGMDIGSAKPTPEERQGIPHYMIDCVQIDRPGFSVSAYRDMAVEAIGAIERNGHLPLVVGGSGLYVNSLIYPLNFAVPSDASIRVRLEMKYPAGQTASAWEALQKADPVTAARLHPNDRKRILRALEVLSCSGQPLSAFGNDFANTAGADAPCDAILFGLTMDRALLYRRIDARVDQMLSYGLLDEARRIAALGLPRTLPAMQSIGYRQLFSYLDGDCTYDEAVERIKRDTRRYAKRQLSWFGRDRRIRWFDVGNSPPEDVAQSIVKQIQQWKNGG